MGDTLHVEVRTWNLGTWVPVNTDLDLAPWLRSERPGETDQPHFLVFGFQELLSQPSAAILAATGKYEEIARGPFQVQRWAAHNQVESNAAANWLKILFNEVERSFPGPQQYIPVAVHRLVAIGIFVFARSDLLEDERKSKLASDWRLNRVRTGAVGGGLFGVYGNKGAVGASLELSNRNGRSSPGSISLCFATAHLQAHEGRLYFDRRNQDAAYFLQSLTLESEHSKDSRKPIDCDALWLFGDFNYRLRQNSGTTLLNSPARSEILRLIADNQIGQLLDKDELSHLLRRRSKSHDIFQMFGFREPEIRFPPTYKYMVQGQPSNSHNLPADLETVRRMFSEKRLPAYCDRILYSAKAKLRTPEVEGEKKVPEYSVAPISITPYDYLSVHNLQWSDHKPVFASFRVDVTGSKHETEVDRREQLSKQQHASIVLSRLSRLWQFGLFPVVVSTLSLYLVFKIWKLFS
ncbi:Endonuclease/exonuclease/phosphatase [Cladochytrium replicatum]|nr:Endonuclease/exonuclease/phosphatase [Cladochytrium replicatum]